MTNEPLPSVEDARHELDCVLDPTSSEINITDKARIAELEAALRSVYPIPHYGEPSGIYSCPVNPYRELATDAEIGYHREGVVCNCGADDLNMILTVALSGIKIK